MPKDEFDFEDPLQLSGVAFLTQEDTTGAMCDCFIEEFMRLGYTSEQILSLFRNPHYLGTNMVLEQRGEQFVRERIGEVFAGWGRAKGESEIRNPKPEGGSGLPAPSSVPGTAVADPLRAPTPTLNL